LAIPGTEDLLVPVLRHLRDGVESSAEMAELIATEMKLTDADKLELMAGSGQTVFRNRISWALVWLGKAGVVEKLATGRYRIQPEGTALLLSNPVKITTEILRAYPGFRYAKTGGVPPAGQAAASALSPPQSATPTLTAASPMDQIAAALTAHNDQLESDLLAEIRAGTATDFERLVVRVIGRVLLPTGGAQRFHHVGKSGDGGIDGVIDEDALGLSRIYLQAKKYQPGNQVGIADIHQFVGAMSAKGAGKGVFVTSSDFTTPARNAADALSKSHYIRLVNGIDLVRMMIANAVGVREIQRVVLYGSDIAGLLAES
jgi:restriction system protein